MLSLRGNYALTRKAGQLQTKRLEAPTRLWIVGLGLRLCLTQPVEIEPSLSLNQSSSAVLTPDAMAGIFVMAVFDPHLT